jgi:adenosylcobinamide-GDP ribazoletransferase
MRTELVAALMFLTRLPVGALAAIPGTSSRSREGTLVSRRSATTGAIAFGLVGALVGAAGALPLLLVADRAPLAAGVLAVAIVALISGALHLDGLADTVDALAAPTAEAADRARKDPRVGPAGAAAIGVVIVADAALLGAVAELRGAAAAALACVVAGAGSRAVAPVAASLDRGSQAGQPRERRLGAWFVARARILPAAVSFLTALLIAAAAASVARLPALALGLVPGTLLAIGLSAWLRSVRGGLDGDGFGFLVEIAFTGVLLITVAVL